MMSKITPLSGVRTNNESQNKSTPFNTYTETVVEQKLKELYPLGNKKVLASLISPLAAMNAQNKTNELFKVAVNRQLLINVRKMYPNSDYPEGTPFELLSIAAVEFFKYRDNKIGASPDKHKCKRNC